MKKFLALFSLLSLFSVACYAQEDDIFLYKMIPISNTARQTQNAKTDTLFMPEVKKFNPWEVESDSKKSEDSVMGKVDAYIANEAPQLSGFIHDPYVIPINGKNYVLVVDKASKKWTYNDLFGIYDSKTNRFKSLISLDTNRDLKVTPQEIRTANLRMVQMNKQGVLLVNYKQYDYNINNILYIDLHDLKRNANCEETGIFGHFNVYFKTPDNRTKIAVGYVTYDYEDDLKFMFK